MRCVRPSVAIAALLTVSLWLTRVATAQAEGSAAPGVVRVATAAGMVAGTLNPTTVTFLGIPFAQPPVGELRWRPPRPHAAWSGVRDATRFGKICPQPRGDLAQPESGEDCLSLNVYVPRRAGLPGDVPAAAAPTQAPPGSPPPRPVMVWIHGGTNTTGGSRFYDPTPLVETGDVVVVTLNYRLGVFGFLAHPAFRAEAGTTGNYGLMDQQLALAWVRANIAAFGGDPANVTVFGESSGGLNVLSHLASPRSAGLFDKAIIQSGTYRLDTPDLPASEELGRDFADRVGCQDQAAACLRAVTTDRAIAVAGMPFAYDGPQVIYNQATVDGVLLRETQRAALAAGRINRVPILLGTNSQEGHAFVPPRLSGDGYLAILKHYATLARRPLADLLRNYRPAAYPAPSEDMSNALAAAAVVTDYLFACSAGDAIRSLARWVPNFAFDFADATASPRGAAHGAELKYLFIVTGISDVLDGAPSRLPAPSQALAAAMQAYWTGFAKSSVPDREGRSPWRPAPEGNIQSLVPPRPLPGTIDAFLGRHRCAEWG